MDFADWNLKRRFEISFLLLWNRRSAFLHYCTLLFQKSECFDSPSDMAGQSWHVPTVQVDMYAVMYIVHTCHRHRSWPCGSTGSVPETSQKNFFQISQQTICGIHPIKNVLEQIFSGVGKCLSCRGSGRAPRATSQIPGTAGSNVHYGLVMLL